MKTSVCTIANGNSTMLFWNIPVNKRLSLSLQALRFVEQVGYLDSLNNQKFKFTMMGNELSINGTLAACSAIPRDAIIINGNSDNPIEYSKDMKYITISLNLPFIRNRNIILFKSIGYIISTRKFPILKSRMIAYCKKFSLPAFGVIITKQDAIVPIVYVKKTDSLVYESACGSGSIAYSIASGIQKIRQPSGSVIFIEKKGNNFSITAAVRSLSYSLPL